MPRTRKKKTYAHTLSEKAFQAHVIQAARMNGFRLAREDPLAPHLDLILHIFDSRKSTGTGFPDLVLVHPKRREVWFCELKTEAGKLSPDQKLWKSALEAVEAATPKVKYRLWRPSMWPEITKELGGVDSRLFV